MGSFEGFVKSPHGILYLIGLNHAGATGDGSAYGQDIDSCRSEGIKH